MKTYLATGAFLLASIALANSAPVWTAVEDNTGQLNVIGRSGDGELRIVIKGPDVKVFALVSSLERGDATAFDVSTTLGLKKAKEKWTASVDPGQTGTLLQAPNGRALLADFLKASAGTFSVRVMPAGKLSVVADFSLSGLQELRTQIDQAQSKKPSPPPATPKPPGAVVPPASS